MSLPLTMQFKASLVCDSGTGYPCTSQRVLFELSHLLERIFFSSLMHIYGTCPLDFNNQDFWPKQIISSLHVIDVASAVWPEILVVFHLMVPGTQNFYQKYATELSQSSYLC